MSTSLLSRLWSHARDALNGFRASLLPLDTLTRREARDIRSWLAALEAFVRRTVLLEALSLDRASLCAVRPRLPSKPKAPARPQKRKPRLRLWPAPKHTGPRIRLLGPPTSVREIWRDQRRAALINRLRAKRGRRRDARTRLADRIDALESLIAAPLRAARRLARKLRGNRPLKLKLTFTRVRDALGLDASLQREGQNAMVELALAPDSS